MYERRIIVYLMDENYYELKHKQYLTKLRELLKQLPPYCGEFMRGIENNTSVLTRYGYAVDLRTFFQFLVSDGAFAGLNSDIRSITLEQLDALKIVDFELFIEYVTYYIHGDKETINKERAKARKLATLRSFYKYFYKKGMLNNTPPALVDLPKIHQKNIIRLEPDEIARLLDTAQDGGSLSAGQKKYHQYTRLRDVAILTLFLGTGIRISELVGVNLEDVNFMADEFCITRKGGNQDILAFGAETRSALLNYMKEREAITSLPGHEAALFLSIQRKRISVRAVENLVKKYAALAAPLKTITPHKLRSTYGTMLYRETGDIYLVADVLGHKDVNTTRKHYAAISEDRRRLAAKVIKLREDDERITNSGQPEKPEKSEQPCQTDGA